MNATNMFAAASIPATSAVAAHGRRVVEPGSRASRTAKLLVRIAPCLALLGLASTATAQQPGPGQWGMRAPLLEPLSELALAEANGKLYLMGGYPQNRVTSRVVQVYDIATNTWTYGPQLPLPNNHGMAASVNGKIYLIGGQLNADDPAGTNSYVNTVYELDPAVGEWVTKAPMPTARSGGVAVAHDGKIYVAGGRLPRGSDFAVYDPAMNSWEVLPILPTQRNHFTGAAINGRIHYVGGRQGNGLSPLMTTAHEVFDPQKRTWTTAAPMLRARSGMNGVMARGLFHVWGGEGPAGMFPDHDYYDPRTNQWRSLPNMPIPVHGVVGAAFVDGLIWVTGGGTGIGGSSGSTLNQVYRPAVPVASIGSRKPHGTSGPFEISLGGAILGVECRSSGGNHTIVFRFVNALNSVGGVSFSGVGSVSSSGVGGDPFEYLVNLTAIANAQVVHVTLTDVSDTAGNQNNITVSMGVLIGDTTGNGSVTASDIAQVKDQSGQAVTAANFRTDVTANGGSVNASDVGLVKSAAGTQLPP
jgi:hypothetical protein